MTKKLIIWIIVVTGGLTNPATIEMVGAQDRVEIAATRKKVRKVKKRTRRRAKRSVSRRAHFAYRGLPKYRSMVNVVPKAAVFIRRGSAYYHYYDGIYYRPINSGFMVIKPVSGLRVTSLPAARQRIIVHNKSYFYYYGTYYTENQGGYTTVDAPEGAIVYALPAGYEIKEVNGTEYYVLENIYYQEVEGEDGREGYEIVSV